MINMKRGISLIVLVITIIVMIILLAAIIISLNNAGVISSANRAVDDTNDQEIKTAIDLKYAEYVIDKSVIGEKTVENWIKDELVNDKVLTNDTKKYWNIAENGKATKFEYYDEQTYNAYARSKGYIVLADDWDGVNLAKGTGNVEWIGLDNSDSRYDSDYASKLSDKSLSIPYGFDVINFNNFITVVEFITYEDSVPEVTGDFKIYPKRVLIPNTVTNINNITLSTTSTTYLTEIEIPETTSISDNAFSNCRNLVTIYYKGDTSKAPWGAPNASVKVVKD